MRGQRADNRPFPPQGLLANQLTSATLTSAYSCAPCLSAAEKRTGNSGKQQFLEAAYEGSSAAVTVRK